MIFAIGVEVALLTKGSADVVFAKSEMAVVELRGSIEGTRATREGVEGRLRGYDSEAFTVERTGVKAEPGAVGMSSEVAFA